MQTIAKLATRLDMSADEIAATLVRLGATVGGPESEISDEFCDMLIDIDEDPAAEDRYLQDRKKKDEQDRKRTERLQKANKKAAAERAAKQKQEDEERMAAEHLEAEAAKAAEAASSAAIAAEAALQPEEETPEPAPVPAPIEPPQKNFAEILPAEEKPEVKPPAIVTGDAAELHEPLVEIVQADGAHERAADATLVAPLAQILPDDDEEPVHTPPQGALAQAERRLEEERRLKAKQKPARPLPVPDPEVVASVIRKAHERSLKNAARPATETKPVRDDDGVFRAPKAPTGNTGKTARKKQKRAEKARAGDENMRREAAAAVRGIQSGAAPGTKKKRKKRDRDDVLGAEEQTGGTLEVEDRVTVEQLAELLDIATSDLILELMEENILASKNQVLDMEMVRHLADKYGYDVRTVIPEEEEILAEEPDAPEDVILRAPVVTVMGHVDHGKTSLLDVVRRANVVAGEAGGITQHIAAYDVEMKTGRVVFLDTPGHEAFTQMRARGTQITDVVVLVVAADDGVKPQTIEAIDHARAADVPIVVAINKCDKPDAQPDRVRQELTRFQLLDEAWGGKTIIRNISAHTGQGIEELMELLVLESEMLELRANPKKRAKGAVIESELSKGHGPVAWVLVQNGTLRTGDIFLCGETHGRVRLMTNSRGESIAEAGPSSPVLVTGFSETPDAGDTFVVVQEERVARSVAAKRAAINKQKRGPAAKHMTLEDFTARMEGAERKTLNIIIKADAQGSVDVLRSSFGKLGNEEVSVNVVHSGVGGINGSDVLLASASDAVIIGFHVTANPKVQKMAEAEGVDVRLYLIIYEAIDQVKQALEGLLTPDSKEVITGHAEVRQVFRSSSLGNIAGSFQQDGTTERGAKARLIRDGVVVWDGRINSIRRNKDDVKAVLAGFECGIKLERYDDVQNNDIIETYRIESVAKTLA